MAHAQLIFVRGPQQGQRVSLGGGSLVVGRSPSADVHIKEPYASREHVRLTLGPDGWLLQNISSNGTMVNAKRFKSAKKQVLLGTGDTLGFGSDSEVLFVAPDDDPEAAVAQWRNVHEPQPAEPEADEANEPAGSGGAESEAAPEPKAANPAAPAPAATNTANAPPAPSIQRQTGAGDHATGPLPVDEDEQAAKRRKLIKYGIMFGAYMVLLLGAAMVIKLAKSDRDPQGGPTGVQRLSDQQIEDILTTPYQASSNSYSANRALDTARMLYDGRHTRPENLYRCFASFKHYRAYKPSNEVMRPEDEQRFQQVGEELVDKVTSLYDAAVVAERARQWPEALARYDELLELLPEEDPADPVKSRLKSNILERRTGVLSELPAKYRNSGRRGRR